MAAPQIKVKRTTGFALVNPASGHFHTVLGTFGPTVELFVNQRDAHFVNRNAHGGRLAVVEVQLAAAVKPQTVVWPKEVDIDAP